MHFGFGFLGATYDGTQQLFLAIHSRITNHSVPYEVLGIEQRLTSCQKSTLPAMLWLWPLDALFILEIHPHFNQRCVLSFFFSEEAIVLSYTLDVGEIQEYISGMKEKKKGMRKPKKKGRKEKGKSNAPKIQNYSFNGTMQR